KLYIWDFGDGSPEETTTTFEVTHTYTQIGTYRIRLIGIDSASCNISDTAYVTVHARDDKAELNFTATKQPPCESLTYLFENLSVAPPGKPFDDNSFIWDFGDGTRVPGGMGSVTHSYANPGSYKVRLVMVDTSYCN